MSYAIETDERMARRIQAEEARGASVPSQPLDGGDRDERRIPLAPVIALPAGGGRYVAGSAVAGMHHAADPSFERMVISMHLARRVKILAVMDIVFAAIWGVLVSELLGPTFAAMSALAVLPAIGAYGAHTFRGPLLLAYQVFLVVSIAFRVWLCLIAGPFLFISSIVIILIDGWAFRITCWLSAALRACSPAEVLEMRAASAQRRMPEPDHAALDAGMAAV